MFNILVPLPGKPGRAARLSLSFSGPEDATRRLALFLAWANCPERAGRLSALAGRLCAAGAEGEPVELGDNGLEPEADIAAWKAQTLAQYAGNGERSNAGAGGWIWDPEDGAWLSPVAVLNYKDPARLELRQAVETLWGWEHDPICLENSCGASLRPEHWKRLARHLPDVAFCALQKLFSPKPIPGVPASELVSLRERACLSAAVPVPGSAETDSKNL